MKFKITALLKEIFQFSAYFSRFFEKIKNVFQYNFYLSWIIPSWVLFDFPPKWKLQTNQRLDMPSSWTNQSNGAEPGSLIGRKLIFWKKKNKNQTFFELKKKFKSEKLKIKFSGELPLCRNHVPRARTRNAQYSRQDQVPTRSWNKMPSGLFGDSIESYGVLLQWLGSHDRYYQKNWSTWRATFDWISCNSTSFQTLVHSYRDSSAGCIWALRFGSSRSDCCTTDCFGKNDNYRTIPWYYEQNNATHSKIPGFGIPASVPSHCSIWCKVLLISCGPCFCLSHLATEIPEWPILTEMGRLLGRSSITWRWTSSCCSIGEDSWLQANGKWFNAGTLEGISTFGESRCGYCINGFKTHI